jgi:hypothetical protein
VQPGSGPPIKISDVRAQREFVAGGGSGWWAAPARSLPHPFDDLTTDFGNDIYVEMMRDAQVAAAILVLKASILEDGVMLAPAVEDQSDSRYKRAVKIRDIAVRMLKRLDQPFDDVLWNMLDGLYLGNKVAEQVFEWQTVGNEELLQLKALKPKPRQLVSFVVDPYMNLIGLIAARPGQAAPPVLVDGSPVSADIILPPDKFCIFTHRPEDGDPRGTSALRPAYEAWWKKRQLGPEYLHYLSQFASPSVWATPPEGIERVPEMDPLGNLTDEDGAVLDPDDPTQVAEAIEPLSPQEELLALLLEWRNGYALAVAPGTQVHTVEMIGDGSSFLNAFQLYDSQITKAILTQSLATEEGQHQSRSAASVHQDVLDTLVRQGKQSLTRMIYYQILIPWVQRNWGDKAAEELVPVPSLGTTERQDLPALMTACAALMRAAYFAPSQLPAVDELLNLPVRDLSQAPVAQPTAAPAPGEPAAPGGGSMGKGGSDTGTPNPGAPSGPAERGGRGAQPQQQPARKDKP